VNQLFIDFMKAYDSFRWEALFNILTGFGTPVKLVKVIGMCLNSIYSRDLVANFCPMYFLLRMVGNKEMRYSHCFSTSLYSTPLGGFK